MIRAIIIDDEPLAREKVKLFAGDEPDIEIVDVCSNGHEAIASYNRYKPDLLFLDIQMPEMNGFEILQHLQGNTLSAVIFITAYDEFALRAFEFHAIDYLLKPYDRERFQRSVAHARVALHTTGQLETTAEQIKVLLDSVHQNSAKLERLIVKTNGKIIFLRLEEVDWIESAGNYVKLHCGNETHLIRETMNGLEQQLNPKKFIRIHRCTIINIEKIKELEPYFNGEYKVILNNNSQVFLSRNYKENFTKVLGKPL
jgi:two-component system LytT family response regulator